MSLNEDDLAYLIDIYNMALDVIDATNVKEYYRFQNDKWKRLSTERLLETIGQAAKKISLETQEKISEIPWKQIIALRNVLAHEYDEVLIVKIWNIAKNDVPVLIKKLESIDDLKPYIY